MARLPNARQPVECPLTEITDAKVMATLSLCTFAVFH